MPFAIALLLVVIAAAGRAEADPGIRTVGAGARIIGCSSWVVGCEGVATLRLGASVVDFGWLDERGSGPIAMVHLASRPDGGAVASQIIASGGFRFAIGRGWIQGGPALATFRVSDRNVRATALLAPDVQPAAAFGGGLVLARGERPIVLALDVGTSLTGPHRYQVLASLVAPRF